MYVVNWSSRGTILDRISDFISDLKTPFNCGGKFVGWNILGIHQTPITNLSFSTSCWISLDVLESRLSVGVAVLIQLFSHREFLKKKTISPHGLLFPFLRLLNFHFRHDNNVFVLGLLGSVAGPVSSLLPVMLTSCLSDRRHLRSLPQHLLLHHWRHGWRHAPSQVSLRAGLNTNIHTHTHTHFAVNLILIRDTRMAQTIVFSYIIKHSSSKTHRLTLLEKCVHTSRYCTPCNV